MKRYIFLTILLCLSVLTGVVTGVQETYAQDEADHSPAFFQNLNGVPLMPGLYEMPGEEVVFDKAEGRIIEGSAVTATQTAETIKAFYSKALPQFGWEPAGSSQFVRGAEKLDLEVMADGAHHVLHVSVRPKD